MNKIKVVPFIETFGTERFKSFLNQQFLTKHLDENSNNCLFEDWKFIVGSDNLNYFVNSKYVRLSFNIIENKLEIKNGDNSISFNIPRTINEFINLMELNNIELYYHPRIDDMFEPKDYLKQSEIQGYYENLLEIMEKSHELI